MNKMNWMIALIAAVPSTVWAQAPLDWIEGSWCGEADGAAVEEHWLPSPGDLRLGLNRTLAGDRTVAFEFLRIVTDEHAKTHYLAQPGGRPETVFALTDSGPNWARFENPEHDFPTLIEYRRDGDRMTARIAGSGDEAMEMTLEFDSCKD